MFGLSETDITIIINTLSQFKEVEKGNIFGSRAKGNYKNGSDIDLVLYGDNISFEITNKISYILNEESILPYHCDVLNFNTLKNDDLKNHIFRVEKFLYLKNKI